MSSQLSNNDTTNASIPISNDQARSFPPTQATVSNANYVEPFVRPMSPLVPTNVGHNQRRRIPMLEVDEDGIEDIQVPLIPAIGRIEDLVRYPSPASSSPSPPTPIITPVPDHGETMIPDFDLENLSGSAPVNGFVIRSREDILWRTYSRTGSSIGVLIERSTTLIPVVPDEEGSPLPPRRRQQNPRRRPVSENPQYVELRPQLPHSASVTRTRPLIEEGVLETTLPMPTSQTSTQRRRVENIGHRVDSLIEHVAQVRSWTQQNGIDGLQD
ncbi:hypothetical protein Z517_05965 [Fonsecaea pedrosoi CBS 271.37]|uniref:Uncharacterized protein n=1 Tax=Fonsecaea pedrosoi CBS 271.37 TaxID=1442368 RepID=A0A0D2GEX5_9EURO|nr:uncharacterized protein Z517_05965 [Fonsecaea pedrosoi CBS 271.37]KIW79353.1 hypothetical protein Z517_05965 [Fonsecaea pedrosoi CBS 271.37]